MDNSINQDEIRPLIDYLHCVADHIPQGLSDLEDAITFTIMDLTMYYHYQKKLKHFYEALTFARSIPKVDDFESDVFCNWVIHDREYLKYMP